MLGITAEQCRKSPVTHHQQKVVEQTKAIVAYEMNVLSLQEGKDKKVLEDFKKMPKGNKP